MSPCLHMDVKYHTPQPPTPPKYWVAWCWCQSRLHDAPPFHATKRTWNLWSSCIVSFVSPPLSSLASSTLSAVASCIIIPGAPVYSWQRMRESVMSTIVLLQLRDRFQNHHSWRCRFDKWIQGVYITVPDGSHLLLLLVCGFNQTLIKCTLRGQTHNSIELCFEFGIHPWS